MNPYEAQPCHIETILVEESENVQKATDVVRKEPRLNTRQIGALRRKAILSA